MKKHAIEILKGSVMWITAIAIFVALAMPLGVAAQDNDTKYNKAKHHHYILRDLGTFGGSRSDITFEPATNSINQKGAVVGGADTSAPTPEPGCYNPFNQADCLISHAFAWMDDHLKDLGTLPGGNFSYAVGINEGGQIAGVSENDQVDFATGNPEFHAVLWDHGKIRDLGTLGGASSFVTSLNDRGQVIGAALNDVFDPVSLLGLGDGTSQTQTRGFLWEHGKMKDLGTLGGSDSFPQFVNERRQVAGMSYTSDNADPNTGLPPMDPFLWENGKMKDLGNFGGTNPLGHFSGSVNGLNNRGQVAGTLTSAGDQTTRVFFWDGEKLSDIGTLGGSGALSNALSEAGEVVGQANIAGDSVFHAFLWKNGHMTDLGSVDGDPCSEAEGLNSKGQIVGESQASDGLGGCVNPYTHALLWENGEPGVDLNVLIPPGSALQLFVATEINDRGEILGLGNPPGCTDNDNCRHTFVMIPCDEEHPGLKGCDYDLVDAAAEVRNQTPVIAGASATTEGNQRRSGLRGRSLPFTLWHQVRGLQAPK